MTTDPTEKRPPVLLISTVLAFANLVVLVIILIAVLDHYAANATTGYVVEQDIWVPFMLATWVQAGVNGLLLLPWRATRRVGLGLLIAVAGAMAAYFVFLVVFVAPHLN